MQSSESREVLAARHALNVALWSLCIDNRWRVVWESRRGDRYVVLAAFGARSGTWQELARIDWLRGTAAGDMAKA